MYGLTLLIRPATVEEGRRNEKSSQDDFTLVSRYMCFKTVCGAFVFFPARQLLQELRADIVRSWHKDNVI